MDRPVNSKIVVVLRVIWSVRLKVHCACVAVLNGETSLSVHSYKSFLPDLLFYKTIDAVLQPKEIIAYL